MAHSLQKPDRLVKFVVPSSVRGQDFDLEARLDTDSLAVEVKCLTDEPDYTAKLLYNRLKKAASQLPKAGRGAIFVMLPPSWIAIVNFQGETRHTIDSIFRNYSRVNAVFFHWEEWTDGAPYGRYLRLGFAINSSPKVTVANIDTLIQTTPDPPKGVNQPIEVSYI